MSTIESPTPVVFTDHSICVNLWLPGDDARFDFQIASIAVNANASRVYLGLRNSHDLLRRNLLVVTVDEAGQVVGEKRRYRDSSFDLPAIFDVTSNVETLLVDPIYHKLYLGLRVDPQEATEETRLLTVYALDPSSGEPLGMPITYNCRNGTKTLTIVHGLVRHPLLNLLYVVGYPDGAVYVFEIDPRDGLPRQGDGQPGRFEIGSGDEKHEIAISPDGSRLYVGTQSGRLEVVDLDPATGHPLQTQTFSAFPGNPTPEPLRFQYTSDAIYLRRFTTNGARLSIWRLNNGLPATAQPVDQENLPVSEVRDKSGQLVLARPFCADPAYHALWFPTDTSFTDAFTQSPIIDGLQMASLPLITPLPTPPPTPLTAARILATTTVAIAVAQNGRAIFVTTPLTNILLFAQRSSGSRVSDYRFRFTIVEAKPLPDQALPQTLSVDLGTINQSFYQLTVNLGSPSPWVNLDNWLKDKNGQVPLIIEVKMNLAGLHLQIEIAEGDPGGGGRLLTIPALDEQVQGYVVQLLLPGYGFDPITAYTAQAKTLDVAREREKAIELLSTHAKRYLNAAQAVALQSWERPQQFVISSHLCQGWQGHLEQLRYQAEALSLLGFNTVIAERWQNIPTEDVHVMLTSFGLKWRSVAVGENYIFEHAIPAKWLDRHSNQLPTIESWALALAEQEYDYPTSRDFVGSRSDVVDIKLIDEPAWYYPVRIQELDSSPEGLAVFHAYLRHKGLSPSNFGHAGWDTIHPIGHNAAVNLPSKRLFYWTMKFFPESAARGFRRASEALRSAFDHQLTIDMNFNNQGRWFRYSLPPAHTDYGSFDWFLNGRLNVATLWTEDWFSDQYAQTWSFRADLLRSAAWLGEQKFGGYVVGRALGSHREGATYKILSLIGHGAKIVDIYNWGPQFFSTDGWSDYWSNYESLADALGLVGRAERLLFPGEPSRGKVALFFPGSSYLWDPGPGWYLYELELEYLHYALTHAGYTIDFVDETDLANGVLATRGYTTLYVTAPNVARAAQEKLREWVQNGGTLAVTPGGLVADEYDEPTDLFDAVLGLSAPRVAVRDERPRLGALASDTLTIANPAIATGTIPLYGSITPLPLAGASLVARFGAGTAGMTTNTYGQGAAIAYGFYPGLQYWRTPDRSCHHLPREWGKLERDVAVSPVRQAKTPRPVVASVEGVEVCRLQSDRGIALVLLNWTDEPIPSFTVEISEFGKFNQVTSVRESLVSSTVTGNILSVTLPLNSVDVLLIEISG